MSLSDSSVAAAPLAIFLPGLLGQPIQPAACDVFFQLPIPDIGIKFRKPFAKFRAI